MEGRIFKKAWTVNTQPKTLEGAKTIADKMVSGTGRKYEVLKAALERFNVPKNLWHQIGKRWHFLGEPSLPVFSPYAAYVLTIDFFFYLAISAGLISSERSSNRIDIAYLYYLPFCMIFVSNDKLHRNTAPLFMRENQEFIWGEDLKADLAKLDAYYSGLPPEVKKLGTMRFASRPPLEGEFLTTKLWDRFLAPIWREKSNEDMMKPPSKNDALVEQLKKFGDAKSIGHAPLGIDIDDITSMTIKREVPLQRGKWRILPLGIEDTNKDD
jgi:hypothetical protein